MNKILQLFLSICIVAHVNAQGLTSGLISVWEFDETNGTSALDSHGDNNGYGSTATIPNQEGKINKSFYFNGSGNYLTVNDHHSINFGTGDMSLSIWFKKTTTGWHTMVSKLNNGGYEISVLKDGKIWVKIGGGTSSSEWTTRYNMTSVNLNEWNHLVVTWENSTNTINIYLNGLLDNGLYEQRSAGVINIDAHAPLKFGTDGHTHPWYFNGNLDQIALFKRILSNSELSALYNSGDGKAYADWDSSPEIKTRDITLQLDQGGKATLTAQQIDNGTYDDDGPVVITIDKEVFDCDDLKVNGTEIPVEFIGTKSQETYGYAGGYNPIKKEYWIPEWSGSTIHRLSSSGQYIDSFDSGQEQVMQLWMDIDNEEEYYTANMALNTITKRIGSNAIWTYDMGDAVAAVTTDKLNVYILANSGDYLTLLDKNSGAFIKNIPLDGDIVTFGSMVYANGNIYIAGLGKGWTEYPWDYKAIHVFDATNGTYKGATAIDIIPFNMSFDGETMWVSQNNSTLYGYKISEGSAYGNSAFNSVTFTATDPLGNSASKTVKVLVQDNIPPNFTDLPSALKFTTDPGLCQAPVPYPTITAADACSSTSVNFSIASGSAFETGQTIVDVSATDEYGNMATDSFIVEVKDEEVPEVLTQGITVQLNALGQAEIELADIDNGSHDACGIAELSLDITSFDCLNVGDNTVTLSAVDISGNTASATAIVTVINDLPEINTLTLPVEPVEINTIVNASATFTDVSPDFANIDWGDGTTSAGIITNGTILDSHTYLTENVYTVSLTLTDICGAMVTEIYQNLIVFNTKGGTLTADGTIWSEQGFYLDNPTSEGKADFSIDIQYKKAKKNEVIKPDGTTQFKFKKGGLDFKSTSYDWLVVTGDKTIFKGAGKVNKTDGYQFIVSVMLGEKKKDKDKFRIKIWTDDNVVIYDTQLNAPDDADPTIEITKGAIKIKEAKVKGKGKGKNNARTATDIAMVDELKEEPSIDAYPNPFDKDFIVNYSGDPDVSRVTLTMMDVLGNQIYSKSFNPKLQTEIRIDFNGQHIKEGIYFIHLNDGIESRIFKMIKN